MDPVDPIDIVDFLSYRAWGLPYKRYGGACQKVTIKPVRKTNVGVAQA